jgi:nicotinate-nucleotide pyrophosphorylase (carboxylating)
MLALAEDLDTTSGDVTSRLTIPESTRGAAWIVARRPGVLCGLEAAKETARSLHSFSSPVVDIFEPRMADGDPLIPGSRIARVEGPVRALLAWERTALNFLQRLSGVASLTARYVEAVADTKAVILDTRKTTPGWRLLEKYAVKCGGGQNHRIGLFDAVLIKDNHLAALADTGDPIGEAISRSRREAPAGMIVEVEVDSLDQLDRALQCRPDIVLIDNFSLDRMREAVRRRDAVAHEILLEASGGIDLSTVAEIARTGVDRISVGALTHSAPALDIGLDFEQA